MSKYSIAFEKDGSRVQGSFLLLGCAVLGPFWLAGQAMWIPAAIYLISCIVTGGTAAFVLPFLSAFLVRKWYLSQGWREAAVVDQDSMDDNTRIILSGLGVMSLGCLAFMAFLWAV